MKRWDDLVEYLQDKNLVTKEENSKKGNTLLWVLAIIGAVTAIAAIAYAVYRYMTPDYLDDFDDEDEDEVPKDDYTVVK